MNRDDVLQMAIEVWGLSAVLRPDEHVEGIGGIYIDSDESCLPELERFAALVETAMRADEREECAKVCDEVEDQAWAQWKAAYKPIDQGRSIGAEECAFAIRERGGAMNDDQTDPECVLLLLMERAFRGPEYANAQTRDWRAHMARVLQCVRENDPMVHELRRVIATLEYKLSCAIKRINHLHTADCYAHGCQVEGHEPMRGGSMMDLLLHNLRTIGTHHCDSTVGVEAADEIERLRKCCRMALEALTLVTDAGENEAERWSVSGGAYEGVKCVAAINAIRAAIPMPHEELADGWCAGGDGMNDAKRGTLPAELERQICSVTVPKNEREWWARREIVRLQESNRLRAELLAAARAELDTLRTSLAEAEEPPRREPLTEEQIRRLYREAWTPESEADEVLAFARAVERAIWDRG